MNIEGAAGDYSIAGGRWRWHDAGTELLPIWMLDVRNRHAAAYRIRGEHSVKQMRKALTPVWLVFGLWVFAAENVWHNIVLTRRDIVRVLERGFGFEL